VQHAYDLHQKKNLKFFNAEADYMFMNKMYLFMTVK